MFLTSKKEKTTPTHRWDPATQTSLSRSQPCSMKEQWLQGPGENKAEKVKAENQFVKGAAALWPHSFPNYPWGLSWAYQHPAARGARGCSGNSALFTKPGNSCLKTRSGFDFLPFGGQFEEHLLFSWKVKINCPHSPFVPLRMWNPWFQWSLVAGTLISQGGTGSAEKSPRFLLINDLLMLVHIHLSKIWSLEDYLASYPSSPVLWVQILLTSHPSQINCYHRKFQQNSWPSNSFLGERFIWKKIILIAPKPAQHF